MKSFNQYILEKRKNQNQNLKISGYDALEPYKNNPDIYISFTNLPKLGINPSQLSSQGTPVGIYFYPLKEVWKDFDHSKRRIDVSFAGSRPNIFIVEKSCNKFIDDLYTGYSKSDYNNDVKKLRKLYSTKIENFDDVLELAKEESKWGLGNPGSVFWKTTQFIANDGISPKVGFDKKALSKWNSVLRNLGYCGFADKSGKSIIHDHEPIQAVFLSKSSFKIIDMVKNTLFSTEINKKALLSNLNVVQAKIKGNKINWTIYDGGEGIDKNSYISPELLTTDFMDLKFANEFFKDFNINNIAFESILLEQKKDLVIYLINKFKDKIKIKFKIDKKMLEKIKKSFKENNIDFDSLKIPDHVHALKDKISLTKEEKKLLIEYILFRLKRLKLKDDATFNILEKMIVR